MYRVQKRDGSIVDFDLSKIRDAIEKAFIAQNKNYVGSVIDFVVGDARPRGDRVGIEIVVGKFKSEQTVRLAVTVARIDRGSGGLPSRVPTLPRAGAARRRLAKQRRIADVAGLPSALFKRAGRYVDLQHDVSV